MLQPCINIVKLTTNRDKENSFPLKLFKIIFDIISTRKTVDQIRSFLLFPL